MGVFWVVAQIVAIIGWWVLFANLTPRRQLWAGVAATVGLVLAYLHHWKFALAIAFGIPAALGAYQLVQSELRWRSRVS